MSNEVVVRQHQAATLDEMKQMANAIAQSGLFGVKEPVQALALMLLAQAEGLHPATVAQDYDIIQGKAARKTNSVLARFQRGGGKVKWLELTDTCAKATFSHPQGGEVTIDWDIARAKRTMVWNGKKNCYEALADRQMYLSYPRALLRARCIAEGVRAVYPAAIGGMLVAEEAEDAESMDIGQEVVVEQPQAKPKAASPPAPTSQAPAESPSGVAGNAAPNSAPTAASQPLLTGLGSPSAPHTVSGPPKRPTLSECLALADEACERNQLKEILPTLAGYREFLSAEDRTTLDSTLAALQADESSVQKADLTPPMNASQQRIIKARLRANGKTIEALEKEIGCPFDQIPFNDFERAQKFASV